MTDLLKLGKKVFTVSVVALTILWSVGVAALVPTTVLAVTCPQLAVGDLVKTNMSTSVYLLNADMQRMYFFNGEVYKTWYKDYAPVQTVDPSCVDAYPLAKTPVSFRPGSRLIQGASPAVYAVLPNNSMLRIADAASAVALYGTKWESLIKGVPDVYLATYDTAAGTLTDTPSNGMLVKKTGENTVYLVKDGTLVKVDGDLATFVAADVHTLAEANFNKLTIGAGTVTPGSIVADPSQGVKGGAVVTPVVTGNLTVSLSADTPAGTNFPAGADHVPFLKLNFTAGTADAVVTGLNVYRTGLSSDNDLGNVYLMDGEMVLATNMGIANGKVMFSLTTGLFTVKAGTTKTITVAASANTANKDYAFSMKAASDVVATGMTVGGSFPMNGNARFAIAVSNPSLASSSMASLTTGGSVNAGETNFLAGQFQIQGTNSNIQIKSVKLTETGTINAATDLANIKLMNGATQLGATVPALNADGTVVFDLSANPLQINAGNTVNLSVYTDVVSGVNRNFRFTIQRNYDVVATDMTYNVGASMTGAVVYMSQVTVNQGSLTVARDVSSPSNYVAPGTSNQTWSTFSVKAAGEAVKVTGLSYTISYASSPENLTWDNLKLVDDQGVQIGALTNSGSTVGTGKTVTLTSLNYIIPANTTRLLSIKADIKSGATSTPLGSQLGAITAQGYTSLQAVTTAAKSGNALNLSTNAFSAALNNATGAVTTVAGASQVKVGSFLLSAGPAEGINVISLTVLTAATNVATNFSNLTVKVGGAQIGSTQNTLANATTYAFTAASPVAIAKGASVTVDVYADAATGVTMTAQSVVSLSAASATGASTNVLQAAITAVTGQNVTINGNGTLTMALGSTPVQTQQVGMGVTAVKVGSYKFSANNNEDLKLNSITITDSGTNSSTLGDFVNFRVMNGSNQVGATIGALSASSSASPGGAAVVTLTDADKVAGKGLVPQNGYITLDLVADVNTYTNGATSANVHTYRLSSADAFGAMSSQSTAATVAATGAADLTVYRTTVGIAGVTTDADYNNSITDAKVVGKFNFTAGPNDDAVISSTTLQFGGSAVSTTVGMTVYLYDGSIEVGRRNVTGTTATVFPMTSSTFTVAKGTTKTLTVKADMTTASYSYNSPAKVFQVNLTGMKWTDGTSVDLTYNPIINLPVGGPSLSF